IQYMDRSQGIDFRANQIDLKLNDISFERPVGVDLSAAVFGAEKQNLKVKARVGPLGAKAESNNLPLEGDLDLDTVPLANLGKTAELPETAFRIGKSQVRLAAKVASFTPLNLTYRLSSPELNLADLRAGAAERKKPEVVKNVTSEGTVLMKDGALTYRGNLSSPEGTIAD